MKSRLILLATVLALLSWSFWHSAPWLQLCAGLAMFLFGMQCLDEGLRQLAGGKLEQVLGRSTRTPVTSLLFGIGGTMLLQSSTLVSLLTIAFISSGLIQLAGGIAIIFGANLGATSGIWLLALAGQGFSLSPLALPLLVFGVLASFNGPRSKYAGRVVLGIAFIFLGIDQIKAGFDAFGGGLDMSSIPTGGISGTLLFAGAGMVATVVLQSSHATLMLILAALAAGQLELGQSLALAIGSNVGSSVSTGIVGALGGNRSGQRLAAAHVLFNVVTATLALLLLVPLTWLVLELSALLGFGSNALLQLALFHTLFNAFGVALFWPWQHRLASLLQRWLPDPATPVLLTAQRTSTTGVIDGGAQIRARHLDAQALESVDAAAAAVARELQHLGQLSLEVICQALCVPVEQLTTADGADILAIAPTQPPVDMDALYQRHVKGVYGDLLSFMGRLELPLDEAHQRYWNREQLTALQLVNAVKDAKHLQKNMDRRLREPDSVLRQSYVNLRRHLFELLRAFHTLVRTPQPEDPHWQANLAELDRRAASFASEFRQQLFARVRAGQLDGLQAGSLMNDLNYAERIQHSLREVMGFADEPESLSRLRQLSRSSEATTTR